MQSELIYRNWPIIVAAFVITIVLTQKIPSLVTMIVCCCFSTIKGFESWFRFYDNSLLSAFTQRYVSIRHGWHKMIFEAEIFESVHFLNFNTTYEGQTLHYNLIVRVIRRFTLLDHHNTPPSIIRDVELQKPKNQSEYHCVIPTLAHKDPFTPEQHCYYLSKCRPSLNWTIF